MALQCKSKDSSLLSNLILQENAVLSCYKTITTSRMQCKQGKTSNDGNWQTFFGEGNYPAHR